MALIDPETQVAWGYGVQVGSESGCKSQASLFLRGITVRVDQSVRLSVKRDPSDSSAARRRRKRGRHTDIQREIGLHLFAWSSRDTITSDAFRLRLLCCSSLPVGDMFGGRRRLRRTHTCTHTHRQTHKYHVGCIFSVLTQLLLTKPISPSH